MNSPWKKIDQIEPTNLQDIISEQVAIDLQAREDRKFANEFRDYQETTEESFSEDTFQEASSDNCESDVVIAIMLQKQFDKEYDEQLTREENKFNSRSKISISYSNYRRSERFEPKSDSEDEEIVDLIDREDWDRFDNVERLASSMPRCGYMKNEAGNMVTKHDTTLAGRKNACKFMSFPPEFQTGDGAEFDLQLSNKVFNSLKLHSYRELAARRHKFSDKKEDLATTEFGIDAFTRLILYKMINNQLLERVNGIVSIGKEAVILHAEGDVTNTEKIVPKECIIKVFKTVLSEFKQRDKYIKDDHRFKDRYCSKQNTRKMVQLWAEKEMGNLSRLYKIGLPCPQVIVLKKHVLVMSLIGENHIAAPKLKDVKLKSADWLLAYQQVIEGMKKMYADAKLIHSDLSEYNILWYDNKCWFIDVSQSVEPSHPNAFHFLFRDCANISSFFVKQGVPDVKSPKDLFTDITGYDYFDRNSLPTHYHTKPKPHLENEKGENSLSSFNFEWDCSQSSSKVDKIVSEADQVQLIDTPVA